MWLEWCCKMEPFFFSLPSPPRRSRATWLAQAGTPSTCHPCECEDPSESQLNAVILTSSGRIVNGSRRMNTKLYYVYILSSQKRGTLYIGVTNNLKRRIHEHKEKQNTGFTERYDVTQLVYYECGAEILSALQREKQLKHWKREWKIQLIERANPKWRDLYVDL